MNKKTGESEGSNEDYECFLIEEKKDEEIQQENQSHVRARMRVTEYGFVNSVIASASVAISRIY